MAFVRPTLAELVDRVQQDFVSRMELTGAVLRRSLVFVLSRVVAGAAHMMHGHLEFLSRQVFPDVAEEENLVRWGSLWGVERNAPTYATGDVTITGSDGWVIPAGSLLVRSDGAEYESQADATVVSGAATAIVTAVVAGLDGNCDADTVLTFESPIAGVDAQATVATGISSGADEEDLENYRTRVLDRMRNAPHGGIADDYVAWAKEITGVTRAWVYPLGLGAGTVVVRFMRDDDPDPIPDSTEVETVQSHIDDLRPVTAAVTVAAPIADALDFTLAVSPDTVAVRAAVEAELVDLMRRESEPGAVLPLSKVRTAIGIAAGLEDYTLTSPVADVAHAEGHIATMGTITWS